MMQRRWGSTKPQLETALVGDHRCRNVAAVTSTVPEAIPAGAMRSINQPRVAIDDELALRPWATADRPAVIQAFSDPDIVHWHSRRITTLTEADEWVEAQRDAWAGERSASFAIVDVATESVLGRAALHTQLEYGTAEIAYWVLPGARRRNVAARAGRAITAWGHGFGFHRIELEHSVFNEPSCRVAQRLGYASEGIKRSSVRHADGPHDMHLHSHLVSDEML